MIDCFTFLDELDLLEVRLNSLAPYIERFVLIEGTLTFSGKKKSLVFDENKDRFKEFNITHIIYQPEDYLLPWGRYWGQVECLRQGIEKESPNETILISDIDEIPNLKDYNGQEGVFKQKQYYYRFNLYSGKNNWKGTDAVLKKNISNLIGLRSHRAYKNSWKNGGWHFCALGNEEQVLYKFSSFAHTELGTLASQAIIKDNMANRLNPYNEVWRGRKKSTKLEIELPSGPDWLLENKHRYKHLFYEELQ